LTSFTGMLVNSVKNRKLSSIESHPAPQHRSHAYGRSFRLGPTSTLYTALSDAIPTMAHPRANPQAENAALWGSPSGCRRASARRAA
jgi:hypothetical protein